MAGKPGKVAKGETEAKDKDGEAGAEGAASPKKKLSPKMLALFAGVPLIVVALLVGGLFAFGVIGGAGEEAGDPAAHGEAAPADAHGAAEAHGAGDAHGKSSGHAKKDAHGATAGGVVFIDLPEIIANLSAEGRQAAFLKVTVSLELDGGTDPHALDPVIPRIVDQFQLFLRELRIEDLSGSAGMFRLKEEMLRRVNIAAQPTRVRDVLFKEMIVQ